MKVASVTVKAMTQGLARGRHVSWKEAGLAADARRGPLCYFRSVIARILPVRLREFPAFRAAV
jgi:hypothetical protein